MVKIRASADMFLGRMKSFGGFVESGLKATLGVVEFVAATASAAIFVDVLPRVFILPVLSSSISNGN
jgi:hypothetical protein